jgi:hypothetical protein
MRQRWGDLLRRDPAYSLNLSIEAEDLRLAWPPRLDAFQQRAAVSQVDSVALDA